MEILEKWFEVHYDGEPHIESGDFDECKEAMLRALDDDCAQMFEVKITMEEIIL